MSKLRSLYRLFGYKSGSGMVGRGDVEASFTSLFPNDLENSRPAEGFTLMSQFYRDMRGDKAAPLEHDGDMLLFQYGTFDFGNGPKFDLNLTRQLTYGDTSDDPEIWQLQLTYSFQPDSDWAVIGSHNAWCPNPESLDQFMRDVLASEAIKRAADREPFSVSLTWDNA